MALKDQYAVLRYGHLGLTFAIVLCGAFFLGIKADEEFGTGPLASLIGGAFGMVAGFYYLLTSVSRLGKEEAASEGKDVTASEPESSDSDSRSEEPPRL